MAARVTRREFLERTTVGGPRRGGARRGRPSPPRLGGGLSVSRLDPGEHQAAQAGRHPHAGLGVGPARHRPAAHAVGRASSSSSGSPATASSATRSPTRRAGTADLTLKGDLAESWTASADSRVWTFKLRQGVKWHNVAPLNGREFVAADVKYCFEQYAKEGVQAFTFQEIEGMETPDKHTVRVHLKTPNALFPQNLAEPVAVIFSARGPRGGRRPQEAPDRHRAVHAEGAHPQGPRGARSATPTTSTRAGRTSTSTSSSRRRTPPRGMAAFRTGQSDFIWRAEPRREVETIRKTNPNARGAGVPQHAGPVRPGAGPGQAAVQRRARAPRASPWPSTARRRSTRCSRATASSAGACRTSTTRTRRRRRRTSARGGSTSRPRRRSSWPRPATRTASRRRCSTTSTSRR